ncbi:MULTISPECIES: phage tail length tape measure family protein [unclassified Aureimonas]|uniref:phage tail length tape measure family protein n=1 Tax=unclassified Aureimonas TaxID=2615206 RepID=UPI000AD7037B|nr:MULTISPECIES: phage tail length tape measure family protein [unclassified Aureimonas]
MSNTVKTLTVRYRQEGGSELERVAKSIARSQQLVAEASQGAYKVVAEGTVRLGGAERGYRALQARLEGMGRATKQFHTDLKALDSAMSAGIVKGEEYARQLAKIQSNLQNAGRATGSDSGAALDISKRFNIGAEAANPARASASVFEEAERAAERLRSQLDPLSAAQRQLNAELATYRDLAAGGVITTRELADAEAMVGARMALAEKTMADVGATTKLTSNQMANLGYQVNDVATMLAMGASPFQILASQGGQVVQALGDGPGGVKGSLAAIGTGIAGMVTPVTAVAAGLLAAGSAAIYFATRTDSAVKPLNEAMENHRRIIGEIADEYGVALRASEEYSSAAARSFALRRSEAELQTSARASLFDAFGSGSGVVLGGSARGAASTGEGRDAFRVAAGYEAFSEPLLKLRKGLRDGTADAASFVEEVAGIANLSPANAALQKMGAELIELARASADAQRQIDSLSTSTERMARKQLSESMGRLREFVPDRRTDADRINAEAEQASGLARSYGELMEIERQRQAGLQEFARVEEVVRAGHELDLRGIGVRSAAGRAEIDAMRTRLDLSGAIMTEEEKRRRIEEVRSLSLAQSRFQEGESLRQRMEAQQDATSSLMLDMQTMGKSQGDIARLDTDYEILELQETDR